jgi:hypothetical protein
MTVIFLVLSKTIVIKPNEHPNPCRSKRLK